MTRAKICCLALLLGVTGLFPVAAAAAPRSGALTAGWRAGAAHPVHVRHAGPARRAAGPYRPRGLRWAIPAAPLLWGGPGSGVTTMADPLPIPSFAERPLDEPRSFATLPARTGIPYPPRPEPTIYRLEGPRDRPLARVIRVSDPEPPGARRTRYVHAETGALLLTVPRR